MKTSPNILFLLSFLSFSSLAQNWELVWQDEFAGSSLNEQKWVHEIGTGSQNGLWGWGNGELQYYKPENTTVSNGTLKITAQEEPNGIVDPFQTWNILNYSSSRIKTDGLFSFKYGKVQARMKTVDGQGFWPAFWMLPSGGSWPCDGEIDIMEQWGNDDHTNISTGAAHVGICPYEPGGHVYSSFQQPIDQGSYADQFHIYEVRWYENFIQWYIDDVLVYEITPNSYSSLFNWPFNDNEWYLILNFAITSSGPNSNTILPSFIEVDWIRVYQENELSGCTDINASNYNNLATLDNGSCTYEVTFQVDLSCSSISPNSVNVTSGNDNWSCDGGISLSDTNQDGIWEGTSFMQEGIFSYIYCGDNWTYNEEIFAYAQSSGDWSCSPNTDYTNYANRQININGPLTIYETWGSCEPCTSNGETYGCTDPVANNYNQNATIENNSCTYPPTTVEFTVDMNGINQPSSNYDNVVVNGSWNGWNGWGVILYDENGDGVYNGSLEIDPGTSFEYVVAVTGVADSWSGWGMQWGDGCNNVNGSVTVNNVGGTSYTSLTPGCTDLVGCMDTNALNYIADATVQEYDQYGNLQCVYTSCDDIPEYGCIYEHGFGAFTEWFNAVDCSSYGGIPCEGTITDISGCTDESATNFNIEATIDDGSCNFDCFPEWNVIVTDQNHSIFINGTYLNSDGELLDEGSLIGVFYYNSNGDFVCAGYTSLENNATQISVMGDDASTEEIDGLTNGDQFEYMVWDILSCQEYTASANYSSGIDYYVSNGISFIDQISVNNNINSQEIELVQGWSIFSTYIQASDPDIISVFNSIAENVIIIKDNLGSAYLPEWNFNGIGNLTNGQGYQIKMLTESNLDIEGELLLPENTNINLEVGWNMIAYLRTSPSPCDLVFNSLTDNNQLVIVKDSNGNAYLPEWNFNGIGLMLSGKGYQLKMYVPATFNYLSNNENYE